MRQTIQEISACRSGASAKCALFGDSERVYVILESSQLRVHPPYPFLFLLIRIR